MRNARYGKVDAFAGQGKKACLYLQEHAEGRHEAPDNAPHNLQGVVFHGNKLAERHEHVDERREHEHVGNLQQLHWVEVAAKKCNLDQHEQHVHDERPRADG